MLEGERRRGDESRGEIIKRLKKCEISTESFLNKIKESQIFISSYFYFENIPIFLPTYLK